MSLQLDLVPVHRLCIVSNLVHFLLLGYRLLISITGILLLLNRPIELFFSGYLLKLCTSLLRWAVVQLAAERFQSGSTLNITFYAPLFVALFLHDIAGIIMGVSMMSFYNKIADPSIGGTYMTLLNTMSNLGSLWPSSVALWLLPKLSFASCIVSSADSTIALEHVHCGGSSDQCLAEGGKCKLINEFEHKFFPLTLLCIHFFHF